MTSKHLKIILEVSLSSFAHGCVLTNNAIPFVEVRGAVKAGMRVEVCKACQPQSSVRVRQWKGDAVWARLGGRTSPFGVRTHSIWCLRRAVNAIGCQSILVMVPGDLWTRTEVSPAGTKGDILTLPKPFRECSTMFSCFLGLQICNICKNM